MVGLHRAAAEIEIADAQLSRLVAGLGSVLAQLQPGALPCRLGHHHLAEGAFGSGRAHFGGAAEGRLGPRGVLHPADPVPVADRHQLHGVGPADGGFLLVGAASLAIHGDGAPAGHEHHARVELRVGPSGISQAGQLGGVSSVRLGHGCAQICGHPRLGGLLACRHGQNAGGHAGRHDRQSAPMGETRTGASTGNKLVRHAGTTSSTRRQPSLPGRANERAEP